MTGHITREALDKAIEQLYRDKARRRQNGDNRPPPRRPPCHPSVMRQDPGDVHISLWEWLFAAASLVFFGLVGIVGYILSIIPAVIVNFLIGMTISKGIRTAGRGVGKAVKIWKRL